MSVKLSTGSIATLLAGGEVMKPVLQILGAKKIAGTTSDRYRLFLSDGVHASSFAMLATQLNGLVVDGSLDKFTVVRLDNFICNLVQPNKRVIIIMELSVVTPGTLIGSKIGEPEPVDPSSVSENRPVSAQPIAPPNAARFAAPQNANNFDQGVRPPGMCSTVFQPRIGAAGTRTDRVIHPISNLNPYQNRWTIRVRVTNKSAIRTWNNPRGEGKLFSMDFLDESGEIRATAFNKECDKFFNTIELNKLYYVSQATLKTANKNFTSIKNDYEMTFNPETVMEPCRDNTDDIPLIQFNFVRIADLIQQDNNSMIDVIGVCKRAAELQVIMTRTTNKELKKRELTLVDKSNTEVTVTLWEEQAENFDGEGSPVIAVKGARVSEFGGRSLSLVNSSTLMKNPNIPESHALRAWFDSEGSTTQTQSISRGGGAGGFETNWKYLKQLKTENLGTSDRPDYFTCKAFVLMAKADSSLYQACPSSDCNKKVVDNNDGTYRCEKCNKEYHEFQWRFMMQMNIADYTDSIWVTTFQEGAEVLLGKKSEQMGELKSKNPQQFAKVMQELHHEQFIFKMRAKMETFNDESRLKVTVVTVTPVDVLSYNKKLIEEIESA